ncbi:MAG: DUF4340 domain-containing protein [Bacteroidia bacterium]
MQKKQLLILILLVGGVAAWFFLKPNTTGTSDKSKTDFAIKNTEQITKIFISNKQEGNVLLEKKNGIWMVNGKYEASKPFMEFFLLETLKKIRVAGPVPLPARQNVIASMATMATKVEIYKGNEIDKVYYVGQPTSDMTGTYMYLEGSKDPYITHVPGFDGFLSTRYPVTEKEWVSKVVMDFKPEDINAVDINFPDNINESFTITRKGHTNDFDITSSQTSRDGKPNYAAVKSYFGMFVNKTCESFIDLTPLKIDSIKKTKPFCVITLTDKKDRIHKLTVYKRESSERDHGVYDNKGNRLAYDPSRLNAFLNNDKRVMVIQDIVFNSIMIKYSDFFLNQTGD